MAAKLNFEKGNFLQILSHIMSDNLTLHLSLFFSPLSVSFFLYFPKRSKHTSVMSWNSVGHMQYSYT